MPKKLAKAVGFGGANLLPDVRVVQYLLNCVPFRLGGPRRELVIDGFAGPGTVDAIRRFQQFRKAEPTGCLTPDRRGDAVLRGLLSFDPFPNRELPYTAAKTVAHADGDSSSAKGGGSGGGKSSYDVKGDSSGGRYAGSKTGEQAKGGGSAYDAKSESRSDSSGGKYAGSKSGEQAKGGGSAYDAKSESWSDSSGGKYAGSKGEGQAKGGSANEAKGDSSGEYDNSKTSAAGAAGSSSAAGKADDSSGGGAAGAKESYQEKDAWGFYNPASPYYQRAGFGPNVTGEGDDAKSAGGEDQYGSGAKGESEAGVGTNPQDPWGFFDPASPYYHVAGKAPGGTLSQIGIGKPNVPRRGGKT